MASAFKAELITYYGESGNCPSDAQDLGSDISGTINSKYVQSIVPNTTYSGAICALEFTFNGGGVNPDIANKKLIFAMMNYAGNGSAKWECSSSDIRQLYLPSICKRV